MTSAVPAPYEYELQVEQRRRGYGLARRRDDPHSRSGKVVSDMWTLQLSELAWLDRIYEYTKGLRGTPTVPEGSSDEVAELAKLSVKNVLGLVRDAFAQNLSVVGYRDAAAKENDEAWEAWQRNRMDARQAEVYRPALTYGAGYVSVTPGADGQSVWRTHSPRQLLAVYDEPTLDAWPQYGLATWIAQKDAKPHRRGFFYDDTFVYSLDLGPLPVNDNGETTAASLKPISLQAVTAIYRHGGTYEGKKVCPIVRFVNARDADDMIVGEIAPLILLQQAINSVNFDRLIAGRFGVRPQWVITGWTAAKEKILKASASRILTFDDPDVKAQSLPPGSIDPYNNVLEEMLQHVAMVAQISPTRIGGGKMANIAAEALAAYDAIEQRKLAAKQESFGESWEQVLRLAAEMDAAVPDAEDAAEDVAADEADDQGADDEGAEVIWRDTEVRTFAAVVDGLVKLAQAGVPIEFLLPMVPGMTQQQITAIKNAMRGTGAASIVDKLLAAPPIPEPDAPPLDQTGNGNSDGSGPPVSGGSTPTSQ
jgi:hypothetical protein